MRARACVCVAQWASCMQASSARGVHDECGCLWVCVKPYHPGGMGVFYQTGLYPLVYKLTAHDLVAPFRLGA